MTSLSNPLAIPIPSRPTTPSVPDNRPRSATLSSTTSDTSTLLQTPQTPPIFSLLSWSPSSPESDTGNTSGIKAKLSRSKSSFRSKTAQLKSTLTPNRSRISLATGPIIERASTEPDVLTPTKLTNYFDRIPRELRLLIFRTLMAVCD